MDCVQQYLSIFIILRCAILHLLLMRFCARHNLQDIDTLNYLYFG